MPRARRRPSWRSGNGGARRAWTSRGSAATVTSSGPRSAGHRRDGSMTPSPTWLRIGAWHWRQTLDPVGSHDPAPRFCLPLADPPARLVTLGMALAHRTLEELIL